MFSKCALETSNCTIFAFGRIARATVALYRSTRLCTTTTTKNIYATIMPILWACCIHAGSDRMDVAAVTSVSRLAATSAKRFAFFRKHIALAFALLFSARDDENNNQHHDRKGADANA